MIATFMLLLDQRYHSLGCGRRFRVTEGDNKNVGPDEHLDHIRNICLEQFVGTM